MIKVRVLRADRLGESEIMFQVRVFKSDDGADWWQAEGAPAVLTYAASEILAITDDSGLTDAEKKQAIVDQLIRPDIETLGLSEAERAMDSINALVSAWPITITL